MQLTSYDHARKRICAEYHQMPGMQLTVRQLERLSGTDRATCHAVLTELGYRRQVLGSPLGQLSLREALSTETFAGPSASPTLDVNFKLQRRVGQLNFYDFLASVDLNDDQTNAGYPDLVPPQTSELEIEANRDLGSYGNTSLRVYGQRIDDIVDTIPIGVSGESPGNIDQAKVYGLEWKGTFQLEPFGWRGAKIDARIQHEESRVRDPLTGEIRPISNNLKDLAELSLRHDVAGTDWAWGGDLSYYFYARDYRLSEVGRQWEGPVWGGLFVEHKNIKGLTVRFSAGNLTNAMSMWQRTVYVDRRTGPVDYIEDRDRRIGPIFSFSVSGKF